MINAIASLSTTIPVIKPSLSDSTSPRMRPPIMVPGMEPRPPNTTTQNAFKPGIEPIVGYID